MTDKDTYEAIKASITQEAVYTFVQTYPWQSPKIYDYPLDAIDFLSLLQKECGYTGVQLRELAEFIYNVIPAYTVQHVRLWLYGWVDIGYFNRAGFSLPYKSLTSKEQTRFKQLSEEYELKQTIEKIKKSTLELSRPAALSTGTTSIYQADIRYLYFEYKQVSVIYQNNKLSFPHLGSTDAYNHLREVSELQQIPLRVHISEDKIESIDNLDRLLKLIHQHKEYAAFDDTSNSPTYRVAAQESVELFYDLASDDFQIAAFSTYQYKSATAANNSAYTENWALRAKISEYLSGLQAPGIMPVLIKRTIVKNDEDDKEETALFSIPTYDGYAIVWHNLDYTKNKADYIFKTDKEHYPQTLLNIIKAIKSIKNIRSTLSANLDSDSYIIFVNDRAIEGIPYEYEKKLTIFRRSLGYVGRILKNRRSVAAFGGWQERFQELLERDIPPLPTAEELDFIKDIENLEIKRAPSSNPIVKHKPSITFISNRLVWTKEYKETWESKKTEVKKIDDKLKTVSDDLLMAEKLSSSRKSEDNPPTPAQSKSQRLKKVLSLLNEVNKLLDIE
ncbi:MAG: hypothetical protein KatS3mg033_2023 [Thermonema sp.]|uniref:hypothetical protein n=1 Tax=Thermonema sp. TaxID=2231181 RepID=UPI0021DED99B|nr:hypothetical protein [Thermonema sp.]GIV40223.1 MAG: hypothetical protein KatS3mg033_2023 [Thermonema sp.]